MSTNATITPESTNENERSEGSTRDQITKKVQELTATVKESFADSDFRGVIQQVERIPSSHRTDELNELLKRSHNFESAQNKLATAKRTFANGSFQQTVDLLSKIPEDHRTDECNSLLKNAGCLAKMAPVLEAGKQHFEDGNFSQVVKTLEGIPKEDRNDECIALLQTAYEKQNEVETLRKKIKEKLDEAADKLVVSLYAEAIPMFERLLSLVPEDEEASRQMKETLQYQKKLENRDQIFVSATERYEDRDYEATIELLETVEEELRKGRCNELLSKAEECFRRLKELMSGIRADICANEFAEVANKLEQLEELHHHPIKMVIGNLSEADYENLLTNLAKSCKEEVGNLQLLENFVQEIELPTLTTFLLRDTQELVEHYPNEGKALRAKLVQMLNELIENPDEVNQRLQPLQIARQHLCEDGPRLSAWEECLELLDIFDEHQQNSWGLRATWVENAKGNELEDAARSLADAADRAFPQGDDRWEWLKQVAQGRLDVNERIVRRVYEKMEAYLKTKQWPPHPLMPITRRRINMSIVTVLLVGLLGSVAQMLMLLLFDIGGLAGYLLVAVLATLWIGFGFVTNKILDEE